MYGTFATFWRDDSLLPSPTINLSHSACPKPQNCGPIVNSVNSHTSLGSQQTFGMCKERTTWLLTCCHELQSLMCNWVSTTAPVARAQQQDVEVQAYRTANSNLQLQDIPFGKQGATLLCDVSTGRARPIVSFRPNQRSR